MLSSLPWYFRFPQAQFSGPGPVYWEARAMGRFVSDAILLSAKAFPAGLEAGSLANSRVC